MPFHRTWQGPAAEAFFDEQARETLSTVNTYLALVADMVKKNDGTDAGVAGRRPTAQIVAARDETDR